MELPLIWQLVKDLLGKGHTVFFAASHCGTDSRIYTGVVDEVRPDGYIVAGSFMAFFDEDDEWKTIRRDSDGTFVVQNV